jgi:lambda family phage portal protein
MRIAHPIVRTTRTLAKMLRRAFDGAGSGGRWPVNGSMWAPARQALAARHQLSSRAGFLDANSPSAASIASVFVTNLVGDGPSVRSRHPNRAMRRALESAFATFYASADLDGFDLAAFLGRVVRSLVTAGEALVVMQTTGRGELRLRLLSPEQLDPTLNRGGLDGGARIIGGVEFNARGERAAYHIFPEQPDLIVSMLDPPIRVDASDVLHVFDPKIPGQVRGVSWLAPVMTRLADLDKLEDALLARMNTAALFGGFITDPEGTAAGFTQGARSGDSVEKSLEPGVIRDMGTATITFPSMPGTEGAADLMRHMLRAIASGVSLPYELLSGDLSQVNYSSAKLGLEQFKRRCKAIRASLLVARLLEPIWQRFVTLEILSGRLNAWDFERNVEDFFSVSFLFPEWAALDPLKDTNADVIALGAGLRSRAEIIAARGRDPEEVDAEIAADTFIPRPAAPGNPQLLEQQNANA